MSRQGFRTPLACLALLTAALLAQPLPAAEVPDPLPAPSNQSPDSSTPVKVYIMMGQSNMVGMGDISGGGSRWGDQFINPVVSVYEGDYSPDANYDAMQPIATKELPKFGGVKPTPYPSGGTHVVRGQVQMPETGLYRFKPGYHGSTYNIMEVDGKEVHRREPGEESTYNTIKLVGGKKYPFKITYLTSDVNGLGWVQRIDIPGTLETVAKREGKFPYLVDEDGNWTVRNDVTYKGVISAVGQGPLTPGLQGNTIGPEMGFGHVMGHYHDAPVLLIKASIGNRSLGWDILPPGSKQYEYNGYTYAGYGDSPSRWETGTKPEPINWYAGKQYDEYVAETKKVLKNFDTLFPQYKDQGYDIAGFVWWQGHKDGGEPHASRYEQNLVHLINTLRKEFDAPKAPFVLATIGFGGWEMSGPHKTVADAQLAVSGEKGKYPEFKGNVKTVEIRDYWRDVDQSPRNQGYHYNRNAETYMLVGEALGRGMVELLEGESSTSANTGSGSSTGDASEDAPAKADACKGWKPLVTGKSLDAWTTNGNWFVNDEGLLTIEPRKGERGWQRFDDYLWTKQQYGDFQISLEFKIPPRGNSGVFVRVGDTSDPVDTGIEVQIMDTHGKKNPGQHDCGGVIQTVGPSKNMAKPAGEWNQMLITCKGKQLSVELNGEQVVDIDLSETSRKDRPLTGAIGLQDHGQKSWFKNVKIRTLE